MTTSLPRKTISGYDNIGVVKHVKESEDRVNKGTKKSSSPANLMNPCFERGYYLHAIRLLHGHENTVYDCSSILLTNCCHSTTLG